MEKIEYARFEKKCFSKSENCKPFCFSSNLSAFISQFEHLHIWALRIFGGQDHLRLPKSECARTPMSSLHGVCFGCPVLEGFFLLIMFLRLDSSGVIAVGYDCFVV